MGRGSILSFLTNKIYETISYGRGLFDPTQGNLRLQ